MSSAEREDRLARLAREALPDVLDAALARARDRATARLADLLADAIVAEALAVERHPARPPAHDPAPPAGTPLYAYAITRADLPLPDDVPALTAGATVARVPDADLALLVSPLAPGELRVDEDDLSETGRLATLARGHDSVLRAAAEAGPVLPLRFGTAVPDEDAARRLLREHGESARRQLDRIGNAREWGVRVVRRLGEPVPAGPQPLHRRDISGTEYLARRRQALSEREAAEATAAEATALVEETLRPHAREAIRRGGAPGSSLLADLALLVAPDGETAFLAAATALHERLAPGGLAVEVSGPWPPYSFAVLEAGDG